MLCNEALLTLGNSLHWVTVSSVAVGAGPTGTSGSGSSREVRSPPEETWGVRRGNCPCRGQDSARTEMGQRGASGHRHAVYKRGTRICLSAGELGNPAYCCCLYRTVLINWGASNKLVSFIQPSCKVE